MNLGSAKESTTRQPFLAFVSDNAALESLKQFVHHHQWPASNVHQGDIATAVSFLKDNPSPHVLLVDIATAAEAKAQLDALADVCDPNVKVIVTGSINEYSFYVGLMEMGISSYLLKPLTLEQLEHAYQKTTEPPVALKEVVKQNGKIICVVGARGGVGATTVAVNLANLIASQNRKPTLLMDLDAQFGSVAMAYDMDPSRGVRDALEKPDRVDGMFLDRVLVKVNDHLSMLSAEESLEHQISANESAAEALMRVARSKFHYVVVDIPRMLTPLTRRFLKEADEVIVVSDASLLSLRDAMRLNDFFKDTLKTKPPIPVLSRVGIASKFEMAKADFEKGLGMKVSYAIPFMPEAIGLSATGEVLTEKFRSSAATTALTQLAKQLVPDSGKVEKSQAAKGFGFLKMKKA